MTVLIGIIIFFKLLFSVFYIWIDFYYSYFILPFLLLIVIYLFINSAIRIKTIIESRENVLESCRDIEDLMKPVRLKIISGFHWIIFVSVCLLIVLTIAGISRSPQQFPFENALPDALSEQQTVSVSNCFGSSAMQSTISFSDGTSWKMKFICDVSRNCSKGFVENWYENDAKSFIMASVSDAYEYQKITYKDAQGEWKRCLTDERIELHLYTDRDYIFMLVTWDKSMPFDTVFSKETLIEYAYILMNQN